MSDITDAVHIGVLPLGGALQCCQIPKKRHKPLDQSFEEGHCQERLHSLEFAQEKPDTCQLRIDEQRILVCRECFCCDRELAEHDGVTISDFFMEVLKKNWTRIFRINGEVCRSHPIDEIAFQNRGIPCDNATALVRSKTVGVGKLFDQFIDPCCDPLLN